MTCHKMRINEQYQCPKCGLSWDCDDTDPPECKNNPSLVINTLEHMIHDYIMKTGIRPLIIYAGRSQVASFKQSSNFNDPIKVRQMTTGVELEVLGMPVIEVDRYSYLEIY